MSTTNPARASRRTLIEPAQQPQLGRVIIEHAFRGARVQRILRLVLVVYFGAVLVFVPPAADRVVCWVIVSGYALWSIALGVVVDRGGRRFLRYVWLAVLVDVAALAALVLVAAEPDPLSWAAYLLANGFFLLPIIAATSLSPGGLRRRHGADGRRLSRGQPAGVGVWHRTGLVPGAADRPARRARTGLRAAVAAPALPGAHHRRPGGGPQRTRRRAVDHRGTGATRSRRDVARRCTAVRARARGRTSRTSAPPSGPKSSTGSTTPWPSASRLLRSTMAQLHPAVLDHAGLPAALRDLVTTVGSRSSTRIDLDVDGWPDGTRTRPTRCCWAPHANCSPTCSSTPAPTRATVRLSLTARPPVLLVSDDGRGMAGVDLAQRLSERHLGRRLAADPDRGGGWPIAYADAVPHGTVATVEVPAVVSSEPRRIRVGEGGGMSETLFRSRRPTTPAAQANPEVCGQTTGEKSSPTTPRPCQSASVPSGRQPVRRTVPPRCPASRLFPRPVPGSGRKPSPTDASGPASRLPRTSSPCRCDAPPDRAGLLPPPAASACSLRQPQSAGAAASGGVGRSGDPAADGGPPIGGSRRRPTIIRSRDAPDGRAREPEGVAGAGPTQSDEEQMSAMSTMINQPNGSEASSSADAGPAAGHATGRASITSGSGSVRA